MLNSKATHLLIRHHEIALKGKNRPEFERRLKLSLTRCLNGKGSVVNVSGRFVIELPTPVTSGSEAELKKLIRRLARVGGVSAVAPCSIVEPELEKIQPEAVAWVQNEIGADPNAKTFAIRTRRVNKNFPLNSMQTDAQIGTLIKKLKDTLSVDLKKPDLQLNVEVRHKHALIYSWEQEGVYGLPMDVTQRVVCLLSGGIDSPVASYEVMRRGCAPVFVHFHSKPYTSEASITKVTKLASQLRNYSPYPLELWLVPLLEIQKAVRDACNERHRTVHYRRFMMRIAQEIAVRRGAKALVTGEALGQVASQTLTNMQVIEDGIELPILRPLIALDKSHIVEKAKELGTFETSIEPHEDTCVLFAPQHPATQAKLAAIREEEGLLPCFDLVFAAVDSAEKVLL
ncbi:MAG: tRNA uracil 4-sulfurtransferase ThiI [Bdellovibrionota bacterium]